MFRIALAATLAIVIGATSLQSETEDDLSTMRKACRVLDEVPCKTQVFCDWHYSGRGARRRGRCQVDPRFKRRSSKKK